MKTLGKLNINPEKVLKNEELVVLSGGYDSPCGSGVQAWNCTVWIEPGATSFSGVGCGLENISAWCEQIIQISEN